MLKEDKEMGQDILTRRDGTPFSWCVLLDAGRKYFSPQSIRMLIDVLKENDYNQLQFAFGNDGLRLILDDMAVDGKSSQEVWDAIVQGNREYNGDPSYLTEEEMDGLLAYAAEKGIEVIPLFNMPGHMNTALYIKPSARWHSGGLVSMNSLDVTDEDAVTFGLALLKKYVSYFAAKGCKHFHFGADEYANDIYQKGGLGFSILQQQGDLDKFASCVNRAAEIILGAGMTPMTFNDGIYYGDDTSMYINPAIEVCYWTKGWIGFDCAGTETIERMGNPLINNNGAWYYVLMHEKSVQKPSQHAEFANFDIHQFPNGQYCEQPAGATFCIWCDESNLLDGEEAMAEAAGELAAMAKQLRKSAFPY